MNKKRKRKSAKPLPWAIGTKIIASDFNENWEWFENTNNQTAFNDRFRAILSLLAKRREILLNVKKRSPDGKVLMSEAARRRRAQGRSDGLVMDHAVPVKTILQKLKDEHQKGDLTGRKVGRILKRYLACVIITQEEDELLTKNGYRSTMPDDWDEVNVFARYGECNIKVSRRRVRI